MRDNPNEPPFEDHRPVADPTRKAAVENTDELIRVNSALRASEERFRSLVETTSDWVWEVNATGVYTYASPKVRELLGYEPEEVIGRTPFDFMHPGDEQKRVRAIFADAVLSRKPLKALENVNIGKDGRHVVVETSGVPILDGEGNVLSYRGVDRDITERKKMEEALRNSEKRFRQLADSALEGLIIYDEAGNILDMNSSILRMSGYCHEEGVGRNVVDFVAPESRERVLRYMGSTYNEPLEVLVNSKDGSPFMTEVQGRDIVLDGKKARVVAVRDISDRKRMEGALRKNEVMYRMITENMTDSIWLMDTDLRTIWISPSVERNRGFTLGEIRAGRLEDQLTPESITKVFDIVSEELTPARLRQKDLDISVKMELEFYRKDGSKIWSEVKLSLIRDPQGSPLGILGVGRDIGGRKRAEEALRHSEERFSKAFRISPAPTVIIAFEDGRCIDVNESFLRMSGYGRDEMIGYTESELRIFTGTDNYGSAVQKLAESGFVRNELFYMRTKSGEIRDVLVSADTIALEEKKFILAMCNDITEQRRLESQLRRSQKMEAVGTLAGGIAHDFNNILSAVIGYTEIALRETDVSDRLRRYLDQILKAGERATSLVKQILTFSRQAEEKPQPMRVSPVIREALQLLRASLPTTIQIRQDIRSDRDTVLADPTQIHQILMNLCTNAAHAMRGSKGELKIGLAPVEVTPFDALNVHHGLPPGMYLNLTVGDTGIGMDQAVMERIFDPFFTTKKPGEGTGMGLSVVHGIVKSCGGAITVKSDPGKGTEFNIYFPLLVEEVRGEPSEAEAGRIPGGTERVLFVDDEEVLVQVGREMLTGLGYEVVGRTSSLEALELFRARPDRFDLVIADMTMPNMTGIELFREITRIRPGMPVVLCSGFSETMMHENARAIGVNEFVMKPIVFQQIAPAIRRALGRRP